jgi:hypothetical protein
MSISNNSCVTISSSYSDDAYTITLPADSFSTYSGDTITLTGASGTSFGGAGTASWSSFNIPENVFSWAETVPFEDGFPEWSEFQEMCKAYPGLQKTYEHLKCFYKMCNDDWQSKKKDIE